MLNKIWNGKINGLPGALFLSIDIGLTKVLNKLYSLVYSNSLNSVGAGTIIYRGLTYRYPKNISIGKNCIINRNVLMGSEFNHSILEIGENVSIATGVTLDFSGNLKISDNVTISENCSILTHDHGLIPRSKPIKKELIIEDNVWIAAGSTILQNVNIIGENSVIASGSIVTKDVPPNSIVGGNPAKVIRFHNTL